MLFPAVFENVASLARSGGSLLVGRGLDRDLGFGVLDSDSFFTSFCVVLDFPCLFGEVNKDGGVQRAASE